MAATGALAYEKRLDVLSNNLANVNTVGFKQDKTRFDYWKRMEFSAEQWAGLKEHAEEVGLVFLSSAFSIEAVQLLDSIGVTAWKIASGEIGNSVFFDEILRTKKLPGPF